MSILNIFIIRKIIFGWIFSWIILINGIIILVIVKRQLIEFNEIFHLIVSLLFFNQLLVKIRIKSVDKFIVKDVLSNTYCSIRAYIMAFILLHKTHYNFPQLWIENILFILKWHFVLFVFLFLFFYFIVS